MSNTSPGTGGRLVRFFLIFLVIAGVLAFKPAKIAYYQSRIHKAWATLIESGGTNMNALAEFHTDRAVLVSLGYYSQKTFPLNHIRPGSPEYRALEKDLRELGTKGMGFFAMQGAETNVAPEVTVWTRPTELPAWESMIASGNRETRNETKTN